MLITTDEEHVRLLKNHCSEVRKWDAALGKAEHGSMRPEVAKATDSLLDAKRDAPVPKNPTNKKAFCTMLYTLYFIQPMLEDWFDDSEQHRNEKAILKRIREAIAEAEKA